MGKEYVDAVDVYSQYFNARYVNGDDIRKAAVVKLTALKDTEGSLTYEISASFFPFRDEEDFLVTDDVCLHKVVLSGLKRRSRKKETELLESLQQQVEEMLGELQSDAVIYWDRPLREARFG